MKRIIPLLLTLCLPLCMLAQSPTLSITKETWNYAGLFHFTVTATDTMQTIALEKSIDGVNYSTLSNYIVSPVAKTWSANLSLDTTAYIRARVTSIHETVSVSNSVKLQIAVPLEAGTIAGEQTICYNTQPAAITIVTNAKGTNIQYQWQYSTTADFSSVSLGTSANVSYQLSARKQTTYVRLQYKDACNTVKYSNVVMVTVLPEIIRPTITSSAASGSTICYQTIPSLLICTEATGADGIFTYQWQQSTDGSNYVNVGADAITYQPEALTQKTWFRIVASNSYCGVEAISEPYIVNVYPPLQVTIAEPTTICYGTNATYQALASGADGNYTYKWYRLNEDTPISTEQSFTTPILTANEFYYCKVLSATCGTEAISNVIEQNVYPQVQTPILAGEQVICYNSVPAPLQLESLPTGGDGIFTYQWEQSTDGISFTTISGATQTSYQPAALTQTTMYRVTISSSCATVHTNAIEIAVRDNLTAPIINSTNGMAYTVCYNFQPAQMTVNTLAGGADGIFTYQWEQSTNGVTYTPIAGATGVSYQPIAITTKTWYRIVATSTTCTTSIASQPIVVDVYAPLQAVLEPITPLCYNSSTTLTATATGADGHYTYTWFQEGVATPIATGASRYYQTPNLQTTTAYYCVVSSEAGCTEATTETMTVNVYDALSAGSIGNSQTICYNTQPAEPLHSIIAPTGGDNHFTYQWQQYANGEWIACNGNESSYMPQPLRTTTRYRLKVINSCGEVYTNEIEIVVLPDLTAPTITSNAQSGSTICYGFVPELLTHSMANGANGQFSYQWQVSTNGENFTDIASAINTSYQPEALTQKTWYRVVATSDTCGTSIVSEPYIVNVYQALTAKLATARNICYGERITLSVEAMGADGQYTYAWYQYGVAEALSIGTSNTYMTNHLYEDTQFYCVVGSAAGCTEARTNTINVHVYPELVSGTIGSSHAICWNEQNNVLDFLSGKPTQGGTNRYTYQWQRKTENGNWEDFPSQTSSASPVVMLTETTWFRVQTYDSCATVTSNEVKIHVQPMPAEMPITGSQSVCYNQRETYSVVNLDTEHYQYEWLLEYGLGEIVTEANNTNTVEIWWNNANVQERVLFKITDLVYGCVTRNEFAVDVCKEKAPNRTILVRKPNSDILIAQEADESLYYQWAYSQKGEESLIPIEDSNHRYVLLPQPYNYAQYDYWLYLRPSATSPCFSLSKYVEENNVWITDGSSKVRIQTLANQSLSIAVNNPAGEAVSYMIYTLSGARICAGELGTDIQIKKDILLSISNGMYLIQVQIGNDVETLKFIVR